jgi:hypothetical protein
MAVPTTSTRISGSTSPLSSYHRHRDLQPVLGSAAVDEDKGVITTSNFFNAWTSHGMNLGTFNYQILATEAFNGGSGSSNITVSG